MVNGHQGTLVPGQPEYWIPQTQTQEDANINTNADTCIRTGSVLDPTEVPFHSHTNRVVCVGQL